MVVMGYVRVNKKIADAFYNYLLIHGKAFIFTIV